MSADSSLVRIDGASRVRRVVQIDHLDGLSAKSALQRDAAQSDAEVGEPIAIVESRTFLRECIRRSVQSTFAIPVETYSSVMELEGRLQHGAFCLVILSLSHGNSPGNTNALGYLSSLVPGVPIVVLSYKNDLELARIAIGHGAKGYIPVTMGFEIAIEAVRFVLAGGTYVPVDCLLAMGASGAASPPPPASGAVTARELAVVRAIQQGKPNKIIAYELNMCESTVKVHVRHIMKKLAAKNRTDVAIKATALLSC
jgi:DNA-binding NarL/FixJ family response regulator